MRKQGIECIGPSRSSLRGCVARGQHLARRKGRTHRPVRVKLAGIRVAVLELRRFGMRAVTVWPFWLVASLSACAPPPLVKGLNPQFKTAAPGPAIVLPFQDCSDRREVAKDMQSR